VSATTVKLLKAAAEIAGSEEALAERLGVTYAHLAMLLDDRIPLPDRLLLRAVDIILEDRQARGVAPQSNAYERPGRA